MRDKLEIWENYFGSFLWEFFWFSFGNVNCLICRTIPYLCLIRVICSSMVQVMAKTSHQKSKNFQFIHEPWILRKWNYLRKNCALWTLFSSSPVHPWTLCFKNDIIWGSKDLSTFEHCEQKYKMLCLWKFSNIYKHLTCPFFQFWALWT